MNYHIVIHYRGNREETVTSESETIIKTSPVNTVWQGHVIAPSQQIAAMIGLLNFQNTVRLDNPVIADITVMTEDEVLEVKAS